MKQDVKAISNAVNEVLKSHNNDKSLLVGILQDVQARLNYLPREALEKVSEGLGEPLSNIYSVATFFRAFSLKPRGRHSVCVCMGTACHVRGAEKILDRMEQELNIKSGDTTDDMKYTLETVNCVGACALGPLVVVDGEYEGQMSADKVKSVLEKYD